MQSASTRRFAPVSLTFILVVTAGLLGGIAALNATDNLPRQSSSVPLTRPASVVTAPSVGEGLIGPGATLDAFKPTANGAPVLGAGEGLTGPGATLETAVKEVPVFGPGDVGFRDASQPRCPEWRICPSTAKAERAHRTGFRSSC